MQIWIIVYLRIIKKAFNAYVIHFFFFFLDKEVFFSLLSTLHTLLYLVWL